MMRLICIAALATVLMSGGGQAHTVNTDAEAASTLLMLVAYSEQPEAQCGIRCGDLSRSSEQIRRAKLTMRQNRPAASFRVAAQKPPM